MNGIRVGVIGLGSIGLRMLVAFEEHPDFVPTLAWDPSSGAGVPCKCRDEIWVLFKCDKHA